MYGKNAPIELKKAAITMAGRTTDAGEPDGVEPDAGGAPVGGGATTTAGATTTVVARCDSASTGAWAVTPPGARGRRATAARRRDWRRGTPSGLPDRRPG